MRVYRVLDWERHYETAKTKGVRHKTWFVVPNKQDGTAYRRLMRMFPSPWIAGAVYGAFVAILGRLSRQYPRRGWLTDTGTEEGLPWTPEDLEAMTGIGAEVFKVALPALAHAQIGWMQDFPFKGENQPLTIEVEGLPVISSPTGTHQGRFRDVAGTLPGPEVTSCQSVHKKNQPETNGTHEVPENSDTTGPASRGIEKSREEDHRENTHTGSTRAREDAEGEVSVFGEGDPPADSAPQDLVETFEAYAGFGSGHLLLAWRRDLGFTDQAIRDGLLVAMARKLDGDARGEPLGNPLSYLQGVIRNGAKPGKGADPTASPERAAKAQEWADRD